VAVDLARCVVRVTTRAMSCAANVTVVADDERHADDLARHAVALITELEGRWSRFLPASELSTINAAAGTPVHVSADTVELVTRLIEAWHLTAGAFDPTLLGTLVELGYAASRDDATRHTSLHPTVAGRGEPAAVLIDAAAGVVQVPRGTALDPGGLGKGLAADLVTAELIAAGASGALVEVGGDLRARGTSPVDSGWTIDVDTGGAGSVRVALADGAVATSTSRLRRWESGGEVRHHLLDPATLRPSAGDAVSCTVVAGTGAWAEAFTKLAFAHDPADAIARLERLGLAASITIDHGGAIGRLTTAAWNQFER
jgi:FAD:protein FMN transferase